MIKQLEFVCELEELLKSTNHSWNKLLRGCNDRRRVFTRNSRQQRACKR